MTFLGGLGEVFNALDLYAYTVPSTDTEQDSLHSFKNDYIKIDFETFLSAATMKMSRSQWGAGSKDTNNPEIVRRNPGWSEFAAMPLLRTTAFLKNGGEIYSKWSAIAATTRGQGDASDLSTTSNKPFLLDSEEACVGWRSKKLNSTKESFLDISIGNQNVDIGDSFLISQGTVNAFRRAAFFMSPRTAYRETAVIKMNTYPVRYTLFHLRTNTNQRYLRGTDQPRTLMYGGDISYVSRDRANPSRDFWTLSLMFLSMYKSDRTFDASSYSRNRDGLQIYNPRLGGFFFPSNRDIRFYSGYVHQKNNKVGRKVNANAYYIEPGYVFSKLWAKPLLTYRYTHYSGDENPGSVVKKSYDPVNSGFAVRDGYGTWETGQIFTHYFSNTNQNVHNIQLKLTPTDNHTVGILYYNIHFDKTQQAGSQSKKAANELNAYWIWTPRPWLVLTALVGAAVAKEGLNQLIRAENPTVSPKRIGKIASFGCLLAAFRF